MGLLASIGVSVIVAAALAVVAARLRQPLIIAYIATGALLGPHVGINLVHDEESIERIAEMAVVVILGALLSAHYLAWEALWLAPLLFLLIRPLAVSAALWLSQTSALQRLLAAWFGIRGVGPCTT